MQPSWKISCEVGNLFPESLDHALELRKVFGGTVRYYMDGIGYVAPEKAGFKGDFGTAKEEKRPKEYAMEVTKVEFQFLQPGNTLGTTDDYEEIVVRAEYQTSSPGKGEECFLTISTETGWSLENPEEMSKVLKSVVDAAARVSKEIL